MISQIEYPGASSAIASAVFCGLLFILSLLFAIKRKKLGFRTLPFATGLWLLSSLVPWINPLIHGTILNQVTYYTPLIGGAVAIVAVVVLLANKGGLRTLDEITKPNKS